MRQPKRMALAAGAGALISLTMVTLGAAEELRRLEPIPQYGPLPAQPPEPARLQSSAGQAAPATVQAAEAPQLRRLESPSDAGAPALLPAEDLRRLESTIQAQEQRLIEQENRLAEQARALEQQRQALLAQQRALKALQAQLSGGGAKVVAATMGGAAGMAPPAQKQKVPAQLEPSEGTPPPAEGTPPPVGEAPPPEEPVRPEVAALAEVGGVLTPKGRLVLEPSVTLSHSSINRFVFQGVEIVEAVLIGAIEASDADRDSITVAGTARYGITDRIEVEAKIPVVYRNDRITNLIISTNSLATQEPEAFDIGDVEFGGHYQINDGREGWPYFVGNLRVKTDTGVSPFEIERNALGIEEELPTGSGFWGVQPSLTWIFPTDPVVFYGNFGYLVNIPRDIDKTIGGIQVGRIDPGDNISVSFGMGLGLNDKTSVSFGYEHNYILKTTTEINGVDTDSQELQVGSLSLGFSYRLTDRVALNLDVKIGATEDAPDAQVSLRVPISIDLM